MREAAVGCSRLECKKPEPFFSYCAPRGRSLRLSDHPMLPLALLWSSVLCSCAFVSFKADLLHSPIPIERSSRHNLFSFSSSSCFLPLSFFSFDILAIAIKSLCRRRRRRRRRCGSKAREERKKERKKERKNVIRKIFQMIRHQGPEMIKKRENNHLPVEKKNNQSQG